MLPVNVSMLMRGPRDEGTVAPPDPPPAPLLDAPRARAQDEQGVDEKDEKSTQYQEIDADGAYGRTDHGRVAPTPLTTISGERLLQAAHCRSRLTGRCRC